MTLIGRDGWWVIGGDYKKGRIQSHERHLGTITLRIYADPELMAWDDFKDIPEAMIELSEDAAKTRASFNLSHNRY